MSEVQFDAIDIHYQLRKRGKTQTDIARHLGVRPQAVNQVIHRKCRSERIEKLIARWLHIPHKVLFPQAAA